MLGTGDTVFHRLIFSSSSGKTCLPSTKFMRFNDAVYEGLYHMIGTIVLARGFSDQGKAFVVCTLAKSKSFATNSFLSPPKMWAAFPQRQEPHVHWNGTP
ncbi:hypothetical protein OOU_Y34scaffold00675g1 [Pyricularia oryzae Y34]|uniref:Uncharacterized protein n=2 Tax=Pyricularia oryzae TaxID=318829 RepID=A0AA97NTC6_PYRO3|nr:hypothetical protein OOU_Y34scaffold00675g1 [Pyricularia oryzae Y34]